MRARSSPAAMDTLFSGAAEYGSVYISYGRLAVVHSGSHHSLTLKAILPLLTVPLHYTA
jgi:hypothetical protein